jgi:hypothetical protein
LSDFELSFSDVAPPLAASLRGPSPPAGVGSPQGATTEAFRAIIVPDAGTHSLTYVLSGFDYFELASVSADVNTFGAAGDVTLTLELGDQTGRTFTKNATGAQIAQFSNGEVTFARFLPDTSTLPGPLSPQILQTGAPIIVQAPGDTVRVVASDAGALVTEMRLWVWDMRTKITFPRPIRPVRVAAV